MAVYPSPTTYLPFFTGDPATVSDFTPTTERIYRILPRHHRYADEDQGGDLDLPLKRYISLTGDQADILARIIDRLAYLDSSGLAESDLTNPALADLGWLPWLAQMIGIPPGLFNGGELRAAIQGWLFDAGSLASVRRVVLSYLADPQRYEIINHADGDPWVVRIYAHPDDADQATWNSWLTDYPTWDQFELVAETWDDAEGVSDLADRRVLNHVRPAGVRFIVLLQAQAWDLVEANVVDWDMWESEFSSWDEYETGDQYF